jgi:hypothetical protein
MTMWAARNAMAGSPYIDHSSSPIDALSDCRVSAYGLQEISHVHNAAPE